MKWVALGLMLGLLVAPEAVAAIVIITVVVTVTGLALESFLNRNRRD